MAAGGRVMAYQVTAPQGVYCLLPTAIVIGKRQISENTRFEHGAILPGSVKPEDIERFLAQGLIAEVE